MIGGLVLQRVVFTEDVDDDARALYLDTATWTSIRRRPTDLDRFAASRGLDTGRNTFIRVDDRRSAVPSGRGSLSVAAGCSVSLATYFNAFPASYWAAWTTVDRVVLRVRTRGDGMITVLRSNARAVIQRVDGASVTGDRVTEFDLPVNKFVDGGWLWFDLTAGDEPLELVSGEWLSPDRGGDGVETATISITTMNRTSYCVKVLETIAGDRGLDDLIDEVIVVDQGTDALKGAEGFDRVSEALGGRLRLIEQPNLGGSGGFARGMAETVAASRSDHVLLLDDDVVVDPEAIRRAVVFAGVCRTPSIVGGHMFDMYARSTLHAFAEGIRMSPFIWTVLTPWRHDLADHGLRQTPWMHRRFDVDYNGWWMCSIPVSTVRSIGGPMPYFIKWDDAEYSLRAHAAGVPTITLPGAAVWHVSWVDKDDSHDWQAFYHARNRLVTALLHSDRPRGGRLSRAFFADDLKNLLTMDYHTVHMRHEAIRSVFQGPDFLHGDLSRRLPRLRRESASFTEGRTITDPSTFAELTRDAGHIVTETRPVGPRGLRFVAWLVRSITRHALAASPRGTDRPPQAHLTHSDATWFVVPQYDSVHITRADGTGVTWHLRDAARFRAMLVRSIRLNIAVRRRWAALSASYRSALPGIVALERWNETFHRP